MTKKEYDHQRYLSQREKLLTQTKVYAVNNREKCNRYQVNWRHTNVNARKNIWLKYRFGITLEQYNDLARKQNNVCAICGNPEKHIDKRMNAPRNLAVDHDRSCCSGKRSCGKCIRGLLCFDCNSGIGKFKDCIELLTYAIKYLKGE